MAKKNPNAPSGSEQMLGRWLDWCVHGIGKDTGVSGSWRYSGHVAYYRDGAVFRFLSRPGRKKPVLLWTTAFGFPTKVPGRTNVQLLRVPDLGVFSGYEDDWTEGDDIHERQRFIMLQRLRTHVAEAARIPAAKLLEKIPAGKEWRKQAREQEVKYIDLYYEDYEDYAAAFQLNWPECPPFYRVSMLQGFDDRERKYQLPENVAARERVKARKLAEDVLEISKKKLAKS